MAGVRARKLKSEVERRKVYFEYVTLGVNVSENRMCVEKGNKENHNVT